jgi:hypothetical protein
MKNIKAYQAIAKLWPLLLIWAFGTISWLLYPVAYVGDDPWFYLVTARNIALHGFQSFSGIFPTNGFHPLWQYLLAGYSYILAMFDPSLLYREAFAVPLSSAMALWGTWNLARIADRLELPRILVAGIPLIFVMLMGMLYSEAHVALAVLATLLWISIDHQIERPSQAFLLGILLGLAFLSRLDWMFFVVFYGLWYVWHVRLFKPIACFATAALLVAVPYLISNYVFFGAAMPVSGWMKSNFPVVFLKGLHLNGLGSSLFGYSIFFGIAPLVISFLVFIWDRSFSSRIASLIWALWFGAAGQFAYIALFTRSASEWYWYYILPVVLGGIGAGIVWRNLQPLFVRLIGGTSRAAWGAVLASAVIVASFSGLTFHWRWGHGLERFTGMALAVDYIHKHDLHAKGMLFSDWPGYVAFACDDYVVAADMLTANRLLYENMKASPDALKFLLDYCRQQGKPVEYVFYLGNFYIVPSKDLHSMVLNDPRLIPERKPIGHIELSQPPSEVKVIDNKTVLTVWPLTKD